MIVHAHVACYHAWTAESQRSAVLHAPLATYNGELD